MGWKSMLDKPRFFKCGKSSIFIDGFDCFCGEFDSDKTAEFWDKDAFSVQVGFNRAFDDFSDVTTDTPFFLCQTRAVNASSNAWSGSADATYFCHGY